MNALPDSNAAGPLGILQSFARAGDTRLKRSLNAAMTAAAVAEIGKGWINRARERATYSVTLSQEDEIYTAVHAWLLTSLPSKSRRALKVRTRSNTGRNEPMTVPDDNESRRSTPHLRVYYDGSRRHTVTIAGHPIKVDMLKDDIDGFKSFEDYARWKPERIVFTADAEAARDAVLDFLAEIAAAEYNTMRPRLFVMDRWGSGWSRVDLPERSLATVILQAGQRDRIVADLDKFLGDETTYSRLGIPWHRGYLFHGPPGTGKTSLAKALASNFGLDVYYIPLSDVKNDTNLVHSLAQLPPRSMLVLEDVDVVHAAKSRDDAESDGISLSGLLNALDGLATPHGLITVMTTNDRDALDPALIRPGRADCTEELTYIDRTQLKLLVALALGGEWSIDLPSYTRNITHAEVLEVLKRHLDEPDRARKELEAFLRP